MLIGEVSSRRALFPAAFNEKMQFSGVSADLSRRRCRHFECCGLLVWIPGEQTVQRHVLDNDAAGDVLVLFGNRVRRRRRSVLRAAGNRECITARNRSQLRRGEAGTPATAETAAETGSAVAHHVRQNPQRGHARVTAVFVNSLGYFSNRSSSTCVV